MHRLEGRACSCRGRSMDENSLHDLCENGQIDKALNLLSYTIAPSESDYLSVLKACIKSRSLFHVRWVYVHLVNQRAPPITGLLGGYLVLALAKCGSIADAYHISEKLTSRTVFTWTALIFAYAECGCGPDALVMHQRMLEDNVQPNCYTFVSLFKACGTIPDLARGKQLHALADEQGFISNNVHVGTALLSMYEKCGAVKEAEEVFTSLPMRNVVSWNVMLSVYVEQGQGEKALRLYRQMLVDGVTADEMTLLFAIQACGLLSSEAGHGIDMVSIKGMCLEIGISLHAVARRKRLVSDDFIMTALLKMYGECGTVFLAENVFHSSSTINIVPWTAMITIYIEHGQEEKALELYLQMKNEQILDEVTVMCILQSCKDRGCLELCKKLHFDISSAGCDENHSMLAKLIDAYGNCGSMTDALAIFEKLPEPDVVAWNACIAGYAVQGNIPVSLKLFEKMKRTVTEPDEVSFLVILSACSHAGLVAKGLEYFECMTRDYGLNPNIKHYNVMTSLLGHGGDFKRLEDMLGTMAVQADLAIWMCLLNACRAHGNLELAEVAFGCAVKLQPNNAASYIMVSKIHADKCGVVADDTIWIREEVTLQNWSLQCFTNV